jgi:hypothetical protein
MIIYRNKHIPVQDFKAFFFCGILFVRGNDKIDDVRMNHELVHSRQYVEVGILSLILLLPLVFTGLWWLWLILSVFAFYILYVIEWFVKFIIYKLNTRKAYRNTSFEREAYNNEKDLKYLDNRKRFAWIKYLK